jgi:CHAT domain-containing protein
LPNSETEVKNIGNLLNGSEQIFVGENASESNFKQNAGEFQIIHLASHFEINDIDPLYSKVILSQKGNTQEDGYLQTYEVFDLRLNADLVVLSACNTALGKLSKGEGLIGISRAFLYAGVPSIVVSLWNVEDEATGKIMEYFYNYLKQGVHKNNALRLAKLEYLKNANITRRDPFFWAPFILFGDLSPIPLEIKPNYLNLTLYSALLLAFVFGFGLLLKGRLLKQKPHRRRIP